MLPVATAAEMRALDAATIRDVGLPGAVLMETAGRAVAAAARAALGGAGGRVAVVCGGGNNGGDGFVAARVLRAAGVDAWVHLVAPRPSIGGDARTFLDAYERSGGVLAEVATDDQLVELSEALARAAVVVDAVFGTGLTRAVEGRLAGVIERINAAPGVRIAVDIPSGLSADTGHPLGVAVRADRTVTMGLPKVGLVTSPGFAWAGVVEVAEIGIPRALIDAGGAHAAVIEAADVEAWRPRADPVDHKGRRGHLLVVAGSPGKRGAGRLSATAALRSGAGLCTLAGPAGPAGELVAPDAVMTAPLASASELRALAAGKAAIAIGPGMPEGELGRTWVDAVLAAGLPAVIDATGLTHLAGASTSLSMSGLRSVAGAAGPVVLTPHPGEAGRLLGTTAAAIEADRLAAVRQLATTARAVVVLKGARTLICDGTLADDFVWINPTGSPALATGGTGDVLTGVIGALLAQGLPAVTAARLGVWVHGRAGEALATRYGARGVVASDLPDAVAGVLASA